MKLKIVPQLFAQNEEYFEFTPLALPCILCQHCEIKKTKYYCQENNDDCLLNSEKLYNRVDDEKNNKDMIGCQEFKYKENSLKKLL